MPFLLMNKKRERHYLLYLICIIALAYLGSLIITSTRDVGKVPSHKRTARMMDRPGGRMPHREAPRMQVYATPCLKAFSRNDTKSSDGTKQPSTSGGNDVVTFSAAV